jgi:hypothetical protein
MGTLAGAETAFSGGLTDPQGKTVADAFIRLFHGSGALVTETHTDSTGQFKVVNIAAGNYRVAAARRDSPRSPRTCC